MNVTVTSALVNGVACVPLLVIASRLDSVIFSVPAAKPQTIEYLTYIKSEYAQQKVPLYLSLGTPVSEER